MVDTAVQTLNSLLLPLKGLHMVLPQSAVAEVVQRPALTPIEGTAEWLVGVFDWRSERVALISYETLSGEPETATTRSSAHIAVLYGLEAIAGLVFYALELQGIPHPVMLTKDTLSTQPDEINEHEVIARNVAIGRYRAVIPNLPRIEYLIRDQLVPEPPARED